MVVIERFKLVIQRNEHLHIKHCKNEVVCRRTWKGPKNGRKQNTLRKHRESELATVGKTGGVLSSAFHVVTYKINGGDVCVKLRIREYMDDLRCCFFGVDDHLKQLSECSKDKLPDFGHLFTHARSCNIFSKVVRRSITKSHQKSQVLYISIISTYHLRKLDEGNCRNPFSFTQHWSGLAARLALVDRTASTPQKIESWVMC